jgi:pimeloyl-ACP methyl ester carboxylesterase
VCLLLGASPRQRLPTRGTALAILLSTLAAFSVACAGEEGASPRAGGAAAEARIHVDQERGRDRVIVKAEGNFIAWADVARGLARAQGYDDSALEDVLPDGRFDVTSKQWQRTCRALNLALSPGIRFEVQRPSEEPARLVISMDRAAVQISKRRMKALLRGAVPSRRPAKPDFGLTLPDGWEKTPPARPLAVIVHGLDSRPERFEKLAGAIRQAGFTCGAFRYPNDQPIADSARLLAGELEALSRKCPDRTVALVTSSMGGLVARAAIEDPELDPGNVRRLIMVAPPNQGSALAKLSFPLELWEHAVEDTRRGETQRLMASIRDGLREAGDDLKPDSPFLRQLNARPRNPKVRYTILLGDSGPIRAEELARLQDRVAKAGERSRWVRFFGPRLQEWLADLDEVVEGKGDGAVSLARGRLQGVDDMLTLRFSHLGAGPDAQKVVDEILRRLVMECQ